MDLGLAAPAAVETDENSQSSSEHDEHSRSSPLLTNNTTDQREESSEQGSNVTREGLNKVLWLSSSKNNTNTNIDQAAEVTILKAKVSFRARKARVSVQG
ncbi:hypothetical protein L1987_08286 [Smallanthus sonchifolius]|uniref:Uncharacterized protein n=1 Tax=Smallanthus sonchifolius TaxID=185202 RepID=A0ACB9JLD1_9ASTR|nr:hypothetical protein L1987_08286 [Smallanthus sonchifolius]